ncbi:MAG: hypothetical protein CML65_08620 [Rhodobacteraceae bacterium]|nr:hypothetical protein [Paracoccaceae bacterium]
MLEGTGRCERAIICPYHGWTYDFDGALVGAAAMEQTVDFERSLYGLTPIRLEVWQGFIWINFDDDADALDAFCRSELAGFKRPRRFVFGELPRTATGKIQKFVLRDRARET